jgi:hypothetical protein
MRTCIEMIRGNYRKLDTINEIISIPKMEITEPKLDTIELEKIAKKKYYEQNRKKVLVQQKEYRDKLKNSSYKIKLLRKLNLDSNYINKTSKKILDKYNITKDKNGIYK